MSLRAQGLRLFEGGGGGVGVSAAILWLMYRKAAYPAVWGEKTLRGVEGKNTNDLAVEFASLLVNTPLKNTIADENLFNAT